jgi:transposase-like protein
MTKRQGASGTIDVKAVRAGVQEFLRALVQTALQGGARSEMTEALGAERGRADAGRQGYRSGYWRELPQAGARTRQQDPCELARTASLS